MAGTERAFVALGSNVDAERNLLLGLRRLAGLGPIAAVSAVYESPALGPPGQRDFLNAAALLRTGLEPGRLRAELRRIEADLGRVRGPDRYAPRPIDLDLCLLGELRLEAGSLVLPDPEVLARPYLARVLAELEPDFPYPGTGERLATIAARLAAGADLRPRPELTAALRRAAATGGRPSPVPGSARGAPGSVIE